MAMPERTRQEPRLTAMKAHSLKVTAASCVLAAGLSLGACATAAAPRADGGQDATNPSSKATLEVVESVPGGQSRHWSLRCDPAGGTMPDAAAACRLLAADTTILHPVRATDIMCPAILQKARIFTITGTWYGTKLHEVVTDGGCDLARWSRMAQIFY
jgi:Subtilisin inhibitor-like